MTTTTFLTIPILRDAIIDLATSNQDDAIANLLDLNLDTIWTPSTVADQTITIDTQSIFHASPLPSPVPSPVYGVDAIGIWIENNKTDFSVSTGSGMKIQGMFSDDGVSYEGTSIHNVEHNGGNLFWFTLTEQFARYWKIIFTGLSGTLPNISQVFLFSTNTITGRPNFPRRKNDRHFNNSVNLTGGRRRVSVSALNTVKNIKPLFKLVSSADEQIMRNIYDESLGSLLPFVYQEGENVEDAFLVRLNQEEPDIVETDFDFFDANMDFTTMPFILDGETL